VKTKQPVAKARCPSTTGLFDLERYLGMGNCIFAVVVISG